MHLSTLNVLVCDDELPILNLFSVLLTGAGFHAHIAVDGQDALREMREHPETNFDAVITDNSMPKLDGLGLVKALRASNYPGKIVVVSGFLDPERTAQYKLLGVDRILAKTEILTQLGTIIRDCFKESADDRRQAV